MRSAAIELVAGFVAPAFEPVRDEFMANMAAGLEVGASYAVSWRGELVVDLWGGHADATRTTALPRDALFNLFSTTKGLMATCIALLVEQGKLSYETPVAEYWPEFAQCGKGSITVGQLMSHQAGICGPSEPVTLEDYYNHDRVANLLAAQQPFFEPGSAWGYHALAIGILADELVRRVDGRSIGSLFAAEIAAPLGLDAYLGLPEVQDRRQVATVSPPELKKLAFDIPNPAACRAALENPVLDPQWPNSRSWRAAGLACCGGSATARSLARLYGVLANGGQQAGARLLSANTVADATRQRIAGIDQVSGACDRYAAGFRLNMNGSMGPSPQAFGHPGWGGTMAFGDPQRNLGVGYTMSQMLIGDWGNVDPRLSRLLSATYLAIGS